jgi:hypothetical protein
MLRPSRYTIAARPRAAALAVVVALALGASTTAASADPTPTNPTTSTTAPALSTMTPDQLTESVQLALQYTDLTNRLASITSQLATAQTDLAAAQNAFEVLDVRYANDQNGLAGAIGRLRGRAAQTYENSDALIGAALEVQHVQQVETAQQYVDAASVADTNDVTHLTTDLVSVKAQRDARADTVRADQGEVTLLNTEHEQMTAQAASDQQQLDALGGVSVLGPAQLTAKQMADWFRSTGAHARLSGTTTIDELTSLYISEGDAAGVRGDVAFAQAIIETGSFEHAADNNYSGIDACDSCTGEPAFPTPQAGVRAQIQLLRSYADPASTADNLGNPPDPTLFGADPAAAAVSYDNFFLKGKVPLWNEMGHGNWATDPNYAGKVLRIYLSMLTASSTP